MKNKYLKTMVSILCLISLAVFIGVAAACGSDDAPEEKTITYTATALSDATVGTAYSATVATASGADGIAYTLKSGSTLPSGLSLSSAGAISGTPTAEADIKFTVVASASGAASAEAEFSLTVVAADGFVMEAEFANLSAMKNMAGSFSPQIFYTSPAASGGKYLGDLAQKDNTIQFDFNSSAAGTATMEVYMKSSTESTVNISPTIMRITVNGATTSYTGTSAPGGADAPFVSFSVNITLQEGANTIKFITTDNTVYMNNATPLMPLFDCIKIKNTEATLTWTPATDNEDEY